MKKINIEDKLIIGQIESMNDFIKIRSILKYNNIDITNLSDFPPLSIRISNKKCQWATSYKFYKNLYTPLGYTFYSVEEFLSEFQVLYEHKGFEGTYELSDGVWHGKIFGIKDLVTYESDNLEGLRDQFITAVEDYRNTKEDINKKETNMKELRWEVVSHTPDKYSLFDYKANEYYTIANIIVNFSSMEKAREFLEELCKSNPGDAYCRVPETFLSEETVKDLILNQLVYMIKGIIITIMESKRSFTRHDILKGIRQIVGVDVEIEYSEWKEYIIECLEEIIDLYEYECEFIDGHYVYSFIDDSIDDSIEDDSKEDDDNYDDDYMNIQYVPVDDTSEPIASKKRHTISADAVREAGGYPGATMYITIAERAIIMDANIEHLTKEWENLGKPAVIFESTLKVDKSCNIRISEYMFDLAGLGYLFGSEIIFT